MAVFGALALALMMGDASGDVTVVEALRGVLLPASIGVFVSVALVSRNVSVARRSWGASSTHPTNV